MVCSHPSGHDATTGVDQIDSGGAPGPVGLGGSPLDVKKDRQTVASLLDRAPDLCWGLLDVDE
jgi:hypothetical protein